MKKTTREIVKEAYEKLKGLNPTVEGIQAFADRKECRNEAHSARYNTKIRRQLP